MREVYLDNNATTKPLPEVCEAMMGVLGEDFGNPSSAHSAGDRVREAMVVARDSVAQLVGAEADQIVFMGCGTEANNTVFYSVVQRAPTGKRVRIVTTTVEHSSIVKMCDYLSARDREALPGEESFGDVRRRMEEEGDPRVSLIDLRRQIENARGLMRPRVREARQSRGARHVQSEDKKADAKVTAAVKHRIQEGYKGKSDLAGESATEKEQREKQVESLVVKHRIDEQDALEKIDETIKAGNLVRWIQSSQSSPAFFDVEALPNLLQVALNTDHPVYSHLYEIMHPDVEELTEDEVRERLAKAAAAFRILIYSWARYEDEQTGLDQRQVRNARFEWGKYAEEFFDEDDGSIDPTDLV